MVTKRYKSGKQVMFFGFSAFLVILFFSLNCSCLISNLYSFLCRQDLQLEPTKEPFQDSGQRKAPPRKQEQFLVVSVVGNPTDTH